MIQHGRKTRIYEQPPQPRPPTTPTPSRALLAEWRLPLQLARLGVHAPQLLRQRTDSPTTAIVIPGWKSPEWTMEPIRRYLTWLGHDVRHWGLGVNRGNTGRDRDRLLPTVRALAEECGHSISLIGWSLGGVVAREVARQAPDGVARVITYGTPVQGGPAYTIGARSVSREQCERIVARQKQREHDQPLTTPLTAIFTRRDTVVDWPASIDLTSPHTTHVEVRSTHVSMGIDPDVWRAVAHALESPLTTH